MTPFEFWADMWRCGAIAAETGLKLAETAQASQAVVKSRSATIAAAARNPLAGDYAELGRMVPEKVAAFTEAGIAAWGDLQWIQAQALGNWQMLARIALAGRAPTTAEASAITARTVGMAKRGARAGGKALAPIHRGATSNARRLRRKKG